MTEHSIKKTSVSEHIEDGSLSPMGDNGVDGEIDEEEEEITKPAPTTSSRSRAEDSGGNNRDANSKESAERRHRPSSDRRLRHHRHHNSYHRDHRRRHSGGDSDLQGVDEDSRTKRRFDNSGDSYFDNNISDKQSHSSLRKHHDRSSRNNLSYGQSRFRHNVDESPDIGEFSESHENPLPFQRDSMNLSKRTMKEKRDSHRVPLGPLSEKGEAEDGEILEDGELDDDEEEVESVRIEASGKVENQAEITPSKNHIKEDKSEKHERKKTVHKDRRKRDSNEKQQRKKKKYTDMDGIGDESCPAPAWGSGYQGPKPKVSPFRSKQLRYGRGDKGYQSPPGLYDSPSYSEGSDEEIVSKALLTEGYIDASVAADEKEGIFNHKNISKKKKRERNYDKVDNRKRGRNMDGKLDGPPKKKPLVDLAMSERPVCKFYLEGKCAKGGGCQFNHDVEKPRKKEVCKYHLTVKGCHKERCMYMHDFPCKYYHTGAKCYSGDRCKFSHDSLTEDTRRALEMRVAAEDIVDMDDPDYNYDYGSRDYDRNRPSLLGSPPRYRPSMKKIPSLFEIEVHPPGQSPKPSPQTVRPSGFYSEINASPKPGGGANSSSGASMNSPNMGMMNNAGSMHQNNQQGFSNNQGNMSGPGLLQAPVRSGNVLGGPMGTTRPNMMINQHGMNPQQQRPGGGPPIQFMGPNQINNQQQQSSNLPPVLNMLGAIIREAAMQKGPGTSSNNINMGPNNNNNIGPTNIRSNNIGPNMNNMGPSARQGNINNIGPNNNIPPNSLAGTGPNNMGMHSNMGNLGPNNVNNMGNMGQNVMVSNSSGGMNNMGTNNAVGNMGPQSMNNMGITDMNSMGPNNMGVMNKNRNMCPPNMEQEVGLMDVDYRIKREYEEMEESSQDLSELDKIRRRLQEQIKKVDEERGEEEEDTTGDVNEEVKPQNKNEELSPERLDGSPDKEDLGDNKEEMKDEITGEVEHIEIPAHLPKKQRELFKRIQQQQMLREREKERERQEALKAAEEAEAKAEVDDWYSSDEDGEAENKPKLTDVLKKLNQESSVSTKETQPSSSLTSDGPNTNSSAPVSAPTASTFNIMQMINAIKKQTTASTNSSSGASPPQTLMKQSSNLASDYQDNSLLISPSSSQTSSTKKQASDVMMANLHLPTLTVDPPVVSARPLKPLVYGVVKISLITSKPYTQLPNDVNASDPAFVNDPRVKWHMQYLEKHILKEQQRRNSTDADKPSKTSDPRLKKGPSDPRLAKAGNSPNSAGDGLRVADPRLQRGPGLSRPADPRLARQGGGNLDPRLNRQNSQEGSSYVTAPMNNMGGGLINTIGGGTMNNIMSTQMGGPMNNQMGGPMNNQMGGPMNNQMGGPINNQMGGPINNQMGGPINNQMGGPINNQMGGPINNNQMGMPINNHMGNMGGPINNHLGGSMNNMGGRQVQGISGPVHNMVPMCNNMNMMNNTVNTMGGGPMNQMGGLINQMGVGQNHMNRMGSSPALGISGEPGINMMSVGMGNRGPVGQQSPLANDSGTLELRINSNPSNPRLGSPRPPNDPRSVADPRFRNKSLDPREQKMNPKDPRSGRDSRSVSISSPNDNPSDSQSFSGNNDPRSLQNNLRGCDDFQQSPNYSQNDSSSFGGLKHPNFSQKREIVQDIDLRLETDGFSSSSSSTMQDLENDNTKPAPKFDHRNDPRFKRVKRFTGQRKGSMEYSSPLGGEEGQNTSDEGGDSGYNSYNRPKISTRDPRNRNSVPSPTLPDTLQDFDLPPLTVAEPEPDLKIKDLFKTIDPTASPFC